MEQEEQAGDSLVSRRSAGIIVALFFVAVGALVMADSVRLGIGWGEDGPMPGYFPFYTGLLMVLASLCTIVLDVVRSEGGGTFVGRGQLRDVLKIFVPSAIYVALIGFIGIYVASALFIAVFMRWLGRFGWATIVILSVAVPFCLFLIFERWFLLPLPKGPLEDLLGY
jgi:hypothetical protein